MVIEWSVDDEGGLGDVDASLLLDVAKALGPIAQLVEHFDCSDLKQLSVSRWFNSGF